jgi:hypothetical protein
MKYVHLGCGLANRLFAMMRMLNTYKEVTFVWEKIGREHITFSDLFETSLNIKIQDYSPTSSIFIHPWDKYSYGEFNTSSKQQIHAKWRSNGIGFNTIACCLCGKPMCIPQIARYIRPHSSLLDDLQRIRPYVGKSVLHIRHNPLEHGYSPKWKHIYRLLKTNFSYIAFENGHHLKYLNSFVKQDDVRNASRNRDYGLLFLICMPCPLVHPSQVQKISVHSTK